MSYNLLIGMPTEDLWRAQYSQGMNIAQALVLKVNQNPPPDLSNAAVANVPDGICQGTIEAISWHPLVWNPELQRHELGQNLGPTTVTLILG